MYFYEKLTKFWLKGDGDMELKERLSEILRLNLAKDYTAVSYAIMVDGKIWQQMRLEMTEQRKRSLLRQSIRLMFVLFQKCFVQQRL